jgi:diguanylate cyclase (GGDEF)-like protein
VRAIYFGEPLNLHRQIWRFVETAYRLIAAPEGEVDASHPGYRQLVRDAGSVLPMALGVLMHQLEADARASVRQSRLLQTALLVATLLLLCLQAGLIFNPIVRRVDGEARRLVESQDQLLELAHYDALTGLPNRTLFHERLEAALAEARWAGRLVAVLQLDLDHFKSVNDTLGHAAGDHLLQIVGNRLRGAVRATDTVARLGGDEFVIVLGGLGSGDEAARVAEQLIRLLGEPVTYQGDTLHTGTSVGITLFPDDDDAPEQLIKNADIALYQAKERGRGTHVFFAREMKARIARRKQLETELRKALERDEIEVVYQPQVRLADGRIATVEALVRWRHPGRGLLLPDEFIGPADDSGLIVPLDRLVLGRALQQMREWTEQGIAPERIAVNLSAGQFRRGGVVSAVEEALAGHGLAPGRLELEVTESVILSRCRDAVMAALERLHGIGVALSLDDFGTGYASLTHVNRFPFQRLKVDRSFIRDLDHDPADALIVRMVIDLCHSLGYEAVAEGVENQAQLDFLQRHGCQLAQGHLLSRPQPADAMTALLQAGGRIALPGAATQQPAQRPLPAPV